MRIRMPSYNLAGVNIMKWDVGMVPFQQPSGNDGR